MIKNAYAEAGVDIDLEATAIKALIGNLGYRRKGTTKMMGSVGHFAGLIDFGEMALALTTDGVGTKMLVADQQEDWSTVGIDCIAMNVNDLYVMNVEPIAFVDYIATDKLSVEKMAQIGIGLNEGAKQANIDIVGGETASLKGLVNGLDLAGTCLGMQKKEKIIAGEDQTGRCDRRRRLDRCPQQRPLACPRGSGEVRGYDKKFKGREDLRRGTPHPDPDLLREPEGYRVLHRARHVPRHRRRPAQLQPARSTGSGSTPRSPRRRSSPGSRRPGTSPSIEMYRTFNMGMGYAYVVPKGSVECVLKMVKDTDFY